MAANYDFSRPGEDLEQLFDEIDNLGPATQLKDGLMTKEDVTKLSGIQPGAQVNPTVDQTPTEGSNNPVSSGGVAAAIAGFITRAVTDLVNYYTKSQTYTKTEVNNLLGALHQFHFEIYATLPATGDSSVLYLIGPSGSGDDKYEEYVYANNTFTKIGDTTIDLSGYVTTEALNTALANYATAAQVTELGQEVTDINRHYPFTINDLVQKYFGTLVVGKYINNSGNEVANNACSYVSIPINGEKFVFTHPFASGWANVQLMLIFTNGSTVTGTNENDTSGMKNTEYGKWFITPIPSGTTTLYINLVKGNEFAAIHLLSTPAVKANDLVIPVPADTNVNLFDGIEGKHYLNSSGNKAFSLNVVVTLPFPVIAGDVYKISGFSTQTLPPSSFNPHYVFMDNKMGFVSSGSFADDPGELTIPSGVSFVAFNYVKTALSTLKITKVISASPTPTPSTPSRWDGKIWAGLGDSLTQQSSSYVGLSWSPMVENATGLEFKNCGIGSTCLAGDGNNAFWKRLSAVEEYNPDIVTILGGANDLYADIPIGTDAEYAKPIAEKDCTTFKGAYSYIIETLLTWKPALRLLLLTTSYAHNNGADHTPGIGLTYLDYANATLSVAEYYGLPIVDLYRNMGLNKLTQGTTYTRGDKIHWNANASQIVASLVIAKLEEINNAIPVE